MDVKLGALALFCPGWWKKVKLRDKRLCGVREELWIRSKKDWSFSRSHLTLESHIFSLGLKFSHLPHQGGRSVEWLQCGVGSGALLPGFRSWLHDLKSLRGIMWIPPSVLCREDECVTVPAAVLRVWQVLGESSLCHYSYSGVLLGPFSLCQFLIFPSFALVVSGRGRFLFYSSTLR